jgi:hypothetical protein
MASHFESMAPGELRPAMVASLAGAAAAFLLAFVLPEGRAFDRLWLLPALAALCATFWAWAMSYRRLQALRDIPESKLISAAQGYASLEGRAAAFPGAPTISPLSHQRCCWYSYSVSRRDSERDSGRTIDSETSDWSFMMSDGTGECVVDPVGAKLSTARVRMWHDLEYNYVERLIVPGDPLCVVGELITSGSTVTQHDIEFKIGELIAQWKKDMPRLKERFDLNRDGEFGETEWRLVRSQARREVEADLARHPPQPQNLVSRPRDGRPFIISGTSRERLEKDQYYWTLLHLAGLLAGSVLLAYFVFKPPA